MSRQPTASRPGRHRRRGSSRSGARHGAGRPPPPPPGEQRERPPPAATRWNNLHLAGDYVDNGLPATIEGAIRSGLAAAARVARNPAAVVTPIAMRQTETPETAEDRQRALP